MESLIVSQHAPPLRLANEHADSFGFIQSQSDTLGTRVAQLVASGAERGAGSPSGWGGAAWQEAC